jgi:hypothetical protein
MLHARILEYVASHQQIITCPPSRNYRGILKPRGAKEEGIGMEKRSVYSAGVTGGAVNT